jgi:hypothetical protein
LIQKLKDLNDDQLRWMLFARIARQLEHFQQSQAKLLSMVGSDGQVHWRSVLEVLPLSERVPLAQHPDLNLMGNLPPHLPVQKVTEVKTPVRGIMLVTEAGLNLQISSERPQLLEWIKAQTLGLKNHTWSEILPYVIVPRSVELFESLANDILQSHGQASRTLKLLAEALSTCQKN